MLDRDKPHFGVSGPVPFPMAACVWFIVETSFTNILPSATSPQSTYKTNILSSSRLRKADQKHRSYSA